MIASATATASSTRRRWSRALVVRCEYQWMCFQVWFRCVLLLKFFYFVSFCFCFFFSLSSVDVINTYTIVIFFLSFLSSFCASIYIFHSSCVTRLTQYARGINISVIYVRTQSCGARAHIAILCSRSVGVEHVPTLRWTNLDMRSMFMNHDSPWYSTRQSVETCFFFILSLCIF